MINGLQFMGSLFSLMEDMGMESLSLSLCLCNTRLCFCVLGLMIRLELG